MSTHTFHVHGMHCAACVMLIEDKLASAEGIANVRAELSSRTVQCDCDGSLDDRAVAERLTPLVREFGYAISTEPERTPVAWHEFLYAAPLAIAFMAAFWLLQGSGLADFISADAVTLPVAFAVGLVASVSTCMAVVGGLVVSLSAQWGQQANRTAPVAFHVGRLLGFFVLGGVIGLLGSAFTLSASATLILSLVVAGVMLALGINLLGIWRGSSRWQARLPRLFSIEGLQRGVGQRAAPFAIGVATFFLPCGFTQAMQVYSLSAGSALSGALTMTTFALGTLPVLVLLSVGSGSIARSKYRGILFKATGIVVILFAVYNVLGGLAAAGWIAPLA